jgi:serum/glucocorticoid-regulated kinase 2
MLVSRHSRKLWPFLTPKGVGISSFLIDLEQLLFSDKLKKINMFGWNQERILAITTEFIYNIKKNKHKRKIPITLLGGLSKTIGSNKTEFTLHVPT